MSRAEILIRYSFLGNGAAWVTGLQKVENATRLLHFYSEISIYRIWLCKILCLNRNVFGVYI